MTSIFAHLTHAPHPAGAAADSCTWDHSVHGGTACGCCQPSSSAQDADRFCASAHACETDSHTPEAMSPAEWMTPEKEIVVPSPRTTRSRSRTRDRKWPLDAASTLAATLNLLERTACGGCPVADTNAVFAPLFHSVSLPDISPGVYLEQWLLSQGLLQKEHMLEPMVLHMVVLIDRLVHRHRANGFHLCASNVHRLLLVTALLSSKALDDESYNSKYWASVGGVSLEHLNELEVYACLLLDWKIHVDRDELRATKAILFASD